MKIGKIAGLLLLILALLCSCTPEGAGSEQAGGEALPAGTKELDFSVEYIRADGLLVDDSTHSVVIRSFEEMEAYCGKVTEGLEQFGNAQKFLEDCQCYDKEYFLDNILIMVMVCEGSGSNRHEVEKVSFTQDTGALQVKIERVLPGPMVGGTCDIAQWHIMIEVKSATVGEGDLNVEILLVDEHSHALAEQPQLLEDMDDGQYDTATAKVSINGKEYTFDGENSAKLLNMLVGLDYDEQQVCECTAELQVESGADCYEINRMQAFARCKRGQVALTWGQLIELDEILQEGFLLHKETVTK